MNIVEIFSGMLGLGVPDVDVSVIYCATKYGAIGITRVAGVSNNIYVHAICVCSYLCVSILYYHYACTVHL